MLLILCFWWVGKSSHNSQIIHHISISHFVKLVLLDETLIRVNDYFEWGIGICIWFLCLLWQTPLNIFVGWFVLHWSNLEFCKDTFKKEWVFLVVKNCRLRYFVLKKITNEEGINIDAFIFSLQQVYHILCPTLQIRLFVWIMNLADNLLKVLI